MALLGIEKQTSDDELSASSGSSSSDCSSSCEDDQKQDKSNGVRKTLATNEDDDQRQGHELEDDAIKRQGAVPPDVPKPTFARRERPKFCASYNSASCCPHKTLPRSKEDDDKTEDSGAMTEEFSDISDDSDIFHLIVDPDKTWMTDEDRDEQKIGYIASLLRQDPFVPPDPEDPIATLDWNDTQSGIALPRAHCAFRGCKWVNDSKGCWEDNLRRHVRSIHLPAMNLQDSQRDTNDCYDFYEAAI